MTQEAQGTQVQLEAVSIPGNLLGAIYNNLNAQPAAQTRGILNALDEVIQKEVQRQQSADAANTAEPAAEG